MSLWVTIPAILIASVGFGVLVVLAEEWIRGH